MIEFRSGGRRVSEKEFFDNLGRKAIELAMKELEERAHGAAASIVDPETGQHPDVFVRRAGETNLVIRTSGSPAFARELERRLEVSIGSIESGPSNKPSQEHATEGAPRLYLAHASEDHDSLARPLAEKLMAEGVAVWFDEWEIRAGDSLRRKMEEGLANCTHFLVLLTPRSLTKPWVQTEIDAGFIRAVGGESRFLGIRIGIGVDELSPFLRTLRCPEVNLDNVDEVNALIADIYGVSRKPPRGSTPRYVQTLPEGLKGWSPAALAIAEFIAKASTDGIAFAPQLDVTTVVQETKLSEQDVRIGILDLAEAGLIETRSAMGGVDIFWPKEGFFVEFDKHFLGLDSKADALAIATFLVNQKIDATDAPHLAAQFPDWPPRRFNSALNYLDGAKLVHAIKAIGSRPYAMYALHVTDRTHRFVRDHA